MLVANDPTAGVAITLQERLGPLNDVDRRLPPDFVFS